MQAEPNDDLETDHDLPPSDDVTRDKISRHLSDINDTISEEDIKNINTGTAPAPDTVFEKDTMEKKSSEIKKDDEDDDPEKEAPTAWEILD